MNLRALAALSCRFLALFTAISLIQSSSVFVSFFASALDARQSATITLPMALLQLAPVAGLILVALLLWTQADFIGARMVGENDESLVSAPTEERWQALAFSVVGLFVLTRALPQLATQIAILLAANSSTSNPYTDVFTRQSSFYAGIWISLAIEIALGLWLLFGARGLVFLLANIRNFGRDREVRQEIESDEVPKRPEN